MRAHCRVDRSEWWMMNQSVRYVGIELLWQPKNELQSTRATFSRNCHCQCQLLVSCEVFFLHFDSENWEELLNISHPVNKHWDMTEFHRWCWPHWMIKCAKRWIHPFHFHFYINHPSSSLNEFLFGKVGTIPRDNFGKMLVVNTRKELCGAFINKCLSHFSTWRWA